MSYKYKHKYQVQLLQTNSPARPGTSRRRTSISGARSRSRCCQRPAAPADHQGWFSKNILQGSEIGIVAQIKIFFKGILYESCVDYCQQKATASKNSNSIEFTNILSQVFSLLSLVLQKHLQTVVFISPLLLVVLSRGSFLRASSTTATSPCSRGFSRFPQTRSLVRLSSAASTSTWRGSRSPFLRPAGQSTCWSLPSG